MTTKEMIAVMQASEEGKTIEYRWNRQYKPLSLDGWESHAEPSWNWAEFEYRVKTKPAEIEVWYCRESGEVDPGKARDEKSMNHLGFFRTKFREVIE